MPQLNKYPNSIKSGHWCPYCSGNVKSTIAELNEFVSDKGGICLSQSYSNAHQKLLWRCAVGHEWKATAHNIKSGHWCPTCSQGVSERICRSIFESIFDKKFPKIRPTWLINPKTGMSLELDGYCKEP